jgi:heat shock protein HslJ
MKSKTPIILILAALSLAILSCLSSGQNASAPSGSSGASDGSPLLGTAWWLIEYQGTTVPESWNYPTVTFQETEASGNSGCNGWRASYSVGGSNISFGEVTASEIMCENPAGIMELEETFIQMLGEAASFELDGNKLTIFTANGDAFVLYELGYVP